MLTNFIITVLNKSSCFLLPLIRFMLIADYYRAKDKFVNEEDTISDMIVENNIKLIVIDSFGGALAGEINDAEAQCN